MHVQLMSMDTPAKLKLLKTKLLQSADFLNTHRTILNAHLVDFITHNVWETCIPPKLGEERLNLTNEEWFEFLKRHLEVPSREGKPQSVNSALSDYVKECCKLTLRFLGVCTEVTTVVQRHGRTLAEPTGFDKFASEKKMHEIEVMAAVVKSLAEEQGIRDIVDIGSGKGYLGSFLALHYNLDVVGIDSSSSNSSGAIKQNRRLKKSWKSFEIHAKERNDSTNTTKKCTSKGPTPTKITSVKCKKVPEPNLGHNSEDSNYVKGPSDNCGNFTPLTLRIDHSSNIDDIFDTVDGSAASVGTSNLLVGLHACGDLTPVMLNLFSTSQRSRVLLNVGCCYNLIEERYCRNSYWKEGDYLPEEFGFPLSKPLQQYNFALGQNARMLACESLDRVISSEVAAHPGIFYRALLQVFLKDKGIELLPNQHVGRIAAKCNNFCDYVRRALQRLNIPTIQIDTNELQDYLQKYQDYSRKLDSFFHLRAMLAPVVESFILMDRLYFLLEKVRRLIEERKRT